MDHAIKSLDEHRLLGGRLCLDFVNTVDGRNGEHPIQYLSRYSDLVYWSVRAGALGEQSAAQLLARSSQKPDEADVLFRQALALREALYRVFAAAIAGERAAASDLEMVNASLAAAMGQARLFVTSATLTWGWRDDDESLSRVLWPIVRSAAELLTSPDLAFVRECPGVDCDWLFLDTSKNHSRHWCAMDSCGNRAKAHRHYQRKRVARTPQA
jgi:predicted RNA-binding Zn ribbon-like protein